MAKRVKPSISLVPIATWEEADDMVRKVGDLTMDIQTEQANAKVKIDNIKEILAGRTADFESQKDLYVRSLEAFCAHHQDGFGDKRSRDMAFGKVGWRKSTKITTKKSTLQRILDVFGRKAAQYIRTKQEPDKEALAKLDDAQLKTVDCTRVITDEFFVEPDVPESVSY